MYRYETTAKTYALYEKSSKLFGKLNYTLLSLIKKLQVHVPSVLGPAPMIVLEF